MNGGEKKKPEIFAGKAGTDMEAGDYLNRGLDTQGPGGYNLARSPEPGARSPEPGARSPEPGARSPDSVFWQRETFTPSTAHESIHYFPLLPVKLSRSKCARREN
jgi:hypothetical protein